MPLACEDLGKAYGGFRALEGISLSVSDAEILGVAGPNGAGKTTLFEVLSGHQKASSGRVVLNGRDVTTMPAFRRARAGLARAFQSPLVPDGLLVREVLEAARSAWRPAADPDEVAEVRELLELTADDAQPAGQLDTLGRRMLLLACLLIRRPSVLLLDEPCSGLLSDEIAAMERVIRRVRAQMGMAIVLIEHRLELLRSLADSVAVLDYGKQIARGAPAEVFALQVVREAYFDAPVAR